MVEEEVAKVDLVEVEVVEEEVAKDWEVIEDEDDEECCGWIIVL